jgi:hypothetical protein
VPAARIASYRTVAEIKMNAYDIETLTRITSANVPAYSWMLGSRRREYMLRRAAF